MKAAPSAELHALASDLVNSISIPVLVNDRPDIAWVSRAAGVHLGQDDVPPPAVRRWSPPSFCIGLSVGTPAEAVRACEIGAALDYWSVGPLYRTTSKPDAGVPLQTAGFVALARLAPPGMPVLGIGGITAANAADVIRAGAAGVAVISAIFGAREIEEAAGAIRAAVDAALWSRREPPAPPQDAR
jgi:thiamine-phosphate pyrophosphorylase